VKVKLKKATDLKLRNLRNIEVKEDELFEKVKASIARFFNDYPGTNYNRRRYRGPL